MEYWNLKKLDQPQTEPQTKTKGATILWDLVIETDRKITSKRQYIIVKDYERKNAF